MAIPYFVSWRCVSCIAFSTVSSRSGDILNGRDHCTEKAIYSKYFCTRCTILVSIHPIISPVLLIVYSHTVISTFVSDAFWVYGIFERFNLGLFFEIAMDLQATELSTVVMYSI